jgi:hypothetical protein
MLVSALKQAEANGQRMTMEACVSQVGRHPAHAAGAKQGEPGVPARLLHLPAAAYSTTCSHHLPPWHGGFRCPDLRSLQLLRCSYASC